MAYKFQHVPAMAIPLTAFPTSLPIIHSCLEVIMLSEELAKCASVLVLNISFQKLFRFSLMK